MAKKGILMLMLYCMISCVETGIGLEGHYDVDALLYISGYHVRSGNYIEGHTDVDAIMYDVS